MGNLKEQQNQIRNIQKQIQGMEKEIDQLIAERRALVQESDALIEELLQNSGENAPSGGGVPETDLDRILTAKGQLPATAKVACQGVPGSYSNSAANQFFDHPEIVFYEQFEDVFHAVEADQVEFGILPIENSTAGSVIQVYDLMVKHNFYILKDTKVLVRHNLLAGVETTMDAITDVYSHPQALSQCMDLQEAYPHIRFHEFSNTAAAAKYVAEQKNPALAAIASRQSALNYGMQVLQSDVQDVKGNATRFICISKKPGFTEGADHFSLCLAVPHKPGALYHLLHKFAINSLNLSRLESRPYPKKKFEYLFYLDIEGNTNDFQVRWLLNDLDHQLGYFKFLGCYDELIVEED